MFFTAYYVTIVNVYFFGEIETPQGRARQADRIKEVKRVERI